jgi:hypothetical protein
MAKVTKKRTARSKKSPARQRNDPKSRPNPRSAATTRSGTKQGRAIEMLQSKDGTSIQALMDATGWQQHSVRGFLAGVVRKRLKLNLVSEVNAGVRTYRITSEPAAPSSKVQRAQSKS